LAAPVLLAAMVAGGCGSSTEGGGGGGGGSDAGAPSADAGLPTADAGAPGADAGTAAQFTITISNFTFSPSNLTVPPGATVTVMNMDSTSHTVTSEAAVGQFTPGAVAGVSFNTGAIAPNGSATFTIPSSAPDGTVIPFFCQIHLQAMANTGQITISGSSP
jgi:plastocyanin